MTSLDYALPYISITEPAPDNLMARKMKMATQESQDEAFYWQVCLHVTSWWGAQKQRPHILSQVALTQYKIFVVY